MFQKLFAEKGSPLQTEVREDEPDTTSRKLYVTSKSVHEKKLKGPPFLSKPEVVFFKVSLSSLKEVNRQKNLFFTQVCLNLNGIKIV